jgi:hypothetical protein
VEDWADGRVRDNFFIFLRERGLLVAVKGREYSDVSEAAEDRAEVEVELSSRSAVSGLWMGVSMRRGVGGRLRRGGMDGIVVDDCGPGESCTSCICDSMRWARAA